MKNIIKLVCLISFLSYSCWSSAQKVTGNTHVTTNLQPFSSTTVLSLSIVGLRQELYKELKQHHLLNQVAFSNGVIIPINQPSTATLLKRNTTLVLTTTSSNKPTQSIIFKQSPSKKKNNNRWSRFSFKKQAPTSARKDRMPTIGIVYTF